MKTSKTIFALVLSSLIFFSSCRTEDEVIIDPPIRESLMANSELADLLNRTALKDGSIDNIIDRASCLSVELPINVTVNGISIVINDDDGYNDIEDIFDDFDNDVDTIIISYPITIIQNDYSRLTINSDSELAALASTCQPDNEIDDDIECIDFKYPFSASVFNQNNEVINTINITNDNELYDFIDDLDDFVAVSINFPITVILSDGTEVTISNLQDLQREIELADDTCDEDDDNDYFDDNCTDCTAAQLTDLFDDCLTWKVEDLERNDVELDEQYSSYTFTFNTNGTLTANQNGTEQTGTWSTTGSGNNINFTINIPNLSDFNATWKLEEIEREFGEAEFELYFGDDELSFYSTCGSESNSGDALSDALTATNTLWSVSSFIDEGDNETAEFAGFELSFSTNGTLSIQNGNATTGGTWSSQKNATELVIEINSNSILDELDEDWKVLSISATEISLQDIDDSTGTVESTLVLTKL